MDSKTKSEHGDNKNDDPATITFRYIQPELTLTPEEIERLRDDNLRSLHIRKKLHLLLDLDNTLVHAREIVTFKTEEIQAFKNMDDVYKIFNGRYIVKLRPGVLEFLNEVNTMFDLSIYTRGTRNYAQTVREILDSKDGGPSRFSYVIAKEDCLKAKRKDLDNVLSHERVVLIVDDRKKVWKNCGHKNLIKINPYFYFPSKKEGKTMDKELTRVLSILKKVHNVFYFDEKFKYVEMEQGIQRDVRDVLQSVTLSPLTSLIRLKRLFVCLESS